MKVAHRKEVAVDGCKFQIGSLTILVDWVYHRRTSLSIRIRPVVFTGFLIISRLILKRQRRASRTEQVNDAAPIAASATWKDTMGDVLTRLS